MSLPEGTIYAIPVRLNDCAVPNQCSNLHRCNFFEADEFEYLLRALQAGRLSPELVAASSQATSLGGAIPVQPTNVVDLTRQPFEPEMILNPAAKQEILTESEGRRLRELMQRTGWHIAQAARASGVHRKSIERKLKRYDLHRNA